MLGHPGRHQTPLSNYMGGHTHCGSGLVPRDCQQPDQRHFAGCDPWWAVSLTLLSWWVYVWWSSLWQFVVLDSNLYSISWLKAILCWLEEVEICTGGPSFLFWNRVSDFKRWWCRDVAQGTSLKEMWHYFNEKFKLMQWSTTIKLDVLLCCQYSNW